jgi:hypothetical protein
MTCRQPKGQGATTDRRISDVKVARYGETCRQGRKFGLSQDQVAVDRHLPRQLRPHQDLLALATPKSSPDRQGFMPGMNTSGAKEYVPLLSLMAIRQKTAIRDQDGQRYYLVLKWPNKRSTTAQGR